MSDIQQNKEQTESLPKWGPAGSAAVSIASRVSVENITHTFSDITALKDVSFELSPGEITCLLGPSGCGKTTLMRIIAGIERPHEGRVIIDDVEVSGPKKFVLPEKRNIGLMFQDFALFPHLSILENVLFGLNNLNKEQAKTEARLALHRVGMTEYEEAFPHMLSGGEQQRVALARAIAPRPAILLMDEPFSGLDHRLRDSVRSETLKILKETGSSAIIVTHDPEEAMFLADRIILMRKGKIVQIGEPKELYNEPVDSDVVRFFSEVNCLQAFVKKGQVDTALGSFKAAHIKNGKKTEILIRPENFILDDKTGRNALIRDVRFMGSHFFANILFEGHTEPLIAKIYGKQSLKGGEVIKLGLKTDQVFIFEIKNGGTS